MLLVDFLLFIFLQDDVAFYHSSPLLPKASAPPHCHLSAHLPHYFGEYCWTFAGITWDQDSDACVAVEEIEDARAGGSDSPRASIVSDIPLDMPKKHRAVSKRKASAALNPK